MSASGATVPARSGTALAAPLADGWAVYDRQFDRVTVVSALAGLILSSGGDPVDRLASEVAEAAGIDEAQAAQAVTAAVDSLVEAGFLVGPPPGTTASSATARAASTDDADAESGSRRLARDRPGTSLSPPLGWQLEVRAS